LKVSISKTKATSDLRLKRIEKPTKGAETKRRGQGTRRNGVVAKEAVSRTNDPLSMLQLYSERIISVV